MATFQLVDFDPTTPAVDHLSVTGANLGVFTNDMVVHPRGGLLFCGERGGLRLIDVDLQSPTLGAAVFVPMGNGGLDNVFAVAVSPAGDRFYAGEYSSHSVVEFSVPGLLTARSWTVGGAPEGLAVR